MDKLKQSKLKLKEEINRYLSIETIDKFLGISKDSEKELEDVKIVLQEYISEISSDETSLTELTVLIHELTILVSKKFQQFNNENSRSIAEGSSINSEDFMEKLELDKAQLKLKYLENSVSFQRMLETLNVVNDKIIEIEKCFAEVTIQEKLCQEKLIEKERLIEEQKKQKEHNEEIRKEEEQKVIQRANEAALEAKLRQQEIDKMKKIIEEENKSPEENIEHFIKFRYDLANSEFGEQGIGCFIKALPGFMVSESDIAVELINPIKINYSFDGTEEIVSNIIHIKTTLSENEDLKFDQPFSVILPHTMSRTQARETKIFRYFEDELRWTAVDTQDVTIEDNDTSGARYVESVFDELPMILTVVSIPKIEDLQYNKRGCSWSAAADSRVNFTIPQGAVKVNLSMKITTVAFDSSLVQEIKTKSKGTNADNIFSFSPLLKIEGENRRFLKPVSISLPLPQKQISKNDSNIPLTVFGSNTDSRSKANCDPSGIEEKIYLLTQDSNKKWVENSQTVVEFDEKKDSIKLEIEKASNWIFMGVRAKVDASPEQIAKGMETIMNHFKLRQIKVIVSHHNEDPNVISVSLCSSSRLDKQLRSLKEEGFDDKNCQISQELEIKEREILTVRFRGNIKLKKENECQVEEFMYSTQLKNKIKIPLEVVDKYAQRAKSKYEGFLSLTTSKWTKKPQPRVEGQPRKNPPQMIDVEEIIPIYEAMLEIPKIQNSSTSKVSSREFHFMSKDYVTQKLIKELSLKIKEDWKCLAKALDLPANRIEEIKTLNTNKKNSSEMAYEVLKLWIMHLPVSKNKDKILKKALDSIHRPDLMEDISI